MGARENSRPILTLAGEIVACVIFPQRSLTFCRMTFGRPIIDTLPKSTHLRIARRREGKDGGMGGALANGLGSPFLLMRRFR